MNDPNASIHLSDLKLDLRGLPRETAEAVPSHLEAALRRTFAENPIAYARVVAPQRTIRLRLDPASPPPAVAGAIASALANSLRSPDPDHSNPSTP